MGYSLRTEPRGTCFGFRRKWIMITIWIFVSMMYSTTNASANFLRKNVLSQDNTVTGTIVDDSNTPLPGASVIIRGTTTGTQTDFDGKFSIDIPAEGASLIISYVGYQSKVIPVNGGDTIDIQLQPDTSSLEEVVVLGYGTVKRNEFVGATSVVKADELQQQPITTVEQGFRGRLAGVQVVQSSGAPGAGVSIRVRGTTSFAGGNEPLYVIDGIPIFNDDVRGLNGIASLNPNDIASIEVLKDASSTAIYGSRAANGVVQITTKSGTTTDKVKVEYNVFTALQTVRQKLDLLSGSEYIDFATEFFNNSVIPGDQSTIDARDNALAQLQSVGNANTDWQDVVYRTGFHQSHNISFTGGNSNNNYYVSANYTEQEGVVRSTDFERTSLRVNLRNKLSEKFKLDTRINFSQSTQNGFLASEGTNTRNFGKSGIGSTLQAVPTIPVFNENGDFSNLAPYSFNDTDIENPEAILTATDRNRINRAQAVMGLTFQITENLANTTRSSLDYIDRKSDFYSPRALTQLGSQNAQLRTSRNINLLLENFLNYKKDFGKVALDVLLGTSAQTDERNSIFLQGTGFPTDDLGTDAIQAAETSAIPETNTIEQSLASFFSRIQLNYDKKYLLSLNARRDGSSVFAENNKFANFGAIGAAWRISEEDFMENTIFDDLKLRGSYGSSGNQAIQPYQSLFLGRLTLTGQGSGSGINVGLAPNLPNPDLTWETTIQTNVGLDGTLLDDRINFSLDYYVKTTKDLLATVSLPQSSGFGSIIDNIGKVENKGLEVQVGGTVLDTGNWYVAANAQFSANKNEVLETKDGQDIIASAGAAQTVNIVREGESLFSFFLPRFVGLDEEGEVYEDINDDGRINGADRQVVGSSLPDYTYGFNTDVRYKNWTLTTNWQGVGGVNVNNVGAFVLTDPDPGFNRLASVREFYPNPRQGLNRQRSSRYIQDASYLRMANIRLSYNFQSKFLNINKLLVYFSGQNLITITDYTGFDPEVNSFSGNDFRQGVDLAAYPSARTFTLGMNVSF